VFYRAAQILDPELLLFLSMNNGKKKRARAQSIEDAMFLAVIFFILFYFILFYFILFYTKASKKKKDPAYVQYSRLSTGLGLGAYAKYPSFRRLHNKCCIQSTCSTK
jgi:hypothetical protein